MLLLAILHAVLRPFGRPQASLPSLDSADMGLADLVSSRQNCMWFFARPDRSNLLVGKPTVPVLQSEVVPVLDGCVGVVVSDSAESQMFRINARRIVAFVHHDHAARYWSDHPFIDIAMRLRALACLISSAGNYSIAPSAFISSPHPARRRFLYASLNRNASLDMFKAVKRSFPAFAHVAQLAKVPAERFALAKKTLFFMLFHDFSRCNGEVMTLP